MEVVQYNRDHKFNNRNLLRVGDLIYFDGPMLTLFMHSGTGYFYLFDWVDRDQDVNRWLMYKVNAVDLMKYINGKISHYDLFDRSPDRKVYFADIANRDTDFDQYNLYLLDSVPDCYIPLKENYFDPNDCPSLERIKAVIVNRNTHTDRG